MAKAKDSRTLELPEEAKTLGLKPGDEVHIFVSQNGAATTTPLMEEEQQEHFRTLTAQLFTEADATERQPGTYSDAQKAQVATLIADKHCKMGMKV
jgi:hypothetical protein